MLWPLNLTPLNSILSVNQSKGNELLRFSCRIEEELGDEARFAGKNFRNPLNK